MFDVLLNAIKKGELVQGKFNALVYWQPETLDIIIEVVQKEVCICSKTTQASILNSFIADKFSLLFHYNHNCLY